MKYIEPPVLLIHSGLGPGDTLGHRKPRPNWYLAKLRHIAMKIHDRMKNASFCAADLCEFSVELLEKEPKFNAGYGAKLQADGKARLSSCFMEGKIQRASGVLNVESTIHPSKLAKLLNTQRDRFLAADGAEQFLFQSQVQVMNPTSPERYNEYLKKVGGKTGTVGAVCLDAHGDTAALTSTGGRGLETPGRVSDSGTVVGNFATPLGAVSCTGIGEDIMDAGLAVAIVSRLEDQMNIQEAVSRAFLRHSNKQFGIIGLDKKSNVIVHATQGTLGFAVIHKNGFHVGLDCSDWTEFAYS